MSAIYGVNVGGNLFDVTDSSNIAPLQLTNFASRTYLKDRAFIMADGLLYRATVDIASGDPIVINGNCKRTTLDEILGIIETDSDLIAPTEDGATSSDDYSIGQQIVRSGLLYEAIDDIAEGDAFSVGGNIELAGTLTEQIEAIKSDLSSLNSDLSNVDIVISENGAKNLLPVTKSNEVRDGITVSINTDPTSPNYGAVTLSGTATGGTFQFDMYGTSSHRLFDDGILKTGKSYKISGTPSDVDGTKVYMIFSTNGSGYVTDSGSGATIDVSEGTTGGNFAIYVVEGTTVNCTFKPMITLASQPNSDYEHYVPYAKTNRELTEVVAGAVTNHIITVTANTNETWSSILSRITPIVNAYIATLPTGRKVKSLNIIMDGRYFTPRKQQFDTIFYNGTYGDTYIDGSNNFTESVIGISSQTYKMFAVSSSGATSLTDKSSWSAGNVIIDLLILSPNVVTT